MKTILVAGGTGGIGLEISRQLVGNDYRVILLGRDEAKGREAIASLGVGAEKSLFHSVDLSTHDGVAAAAKIVLRETDTLDAIVHASGVLLMNDVRTKDGLNQYFAVNYLSRYHLTQRLLPALRKSEHGRVIMMTAKAELDGKIDFDAFPEYEAFNFSRQTAQIHIANLHYAHRLAKTEPRLLAGAINAGAANTGILRKAPTYMRVMARLIGPLFFFNSVEDSAHNVVRASIDYSWPTATYWPKPGDFEQREHINMDIEDTRRVAEISQQLTGV